MQSIGVDKVGLERLQGVVSGVLGVVWGRRILGLALVLVVVPIEWSVTRNIGTR